MTEESFPFPTETSLLSGMELADSQQKHRIVVLLADISNSMNAEIPDSGTRIEALNQELQQWIPLVNREGEASLRTAQLAVITFGGSGVQITSGDPNRPPHEDGGAFVYAIDFKMGPLNAGGHTPMIEAINMGIGLAQSRQRYLKKKYNLTTGQPRLIMFSDGRPTDDKGRATPNWLPVAEQLQALRDQRRLYFLAFGVPGANHELLRQLAPQGGYFELHEIDFQRLLNNILMATTADDPYTALSERHRGYSR